jgi:Big-like domain-containing protein
MRFRLPAFDMAPAALLVTCLAACGGSEETPTEVFVPVPSLALFTPDFRVIQTLGESGPFIAQILDQRGDLMSGVSVTWASSDESVATVDSDGTTTGLANGTAEISVSSGGTLISGTANVTVEQFVTRVEILGASVVNLAPEGAHQLSGVAYDLGGSEVVVGGFTWSSDDEAVATIAADGTITAIAPGSATITLIFTHPFEGDGVVTTSITVVVSGS